MDITYIPMARGFVYLAAVVDVFSRGGFSRIGCRSRWKPTSCIEALEEALARHGKPDIFNSDHGIWFTSVDFTGVLLKHGVAISMDGRGALRDNVFVERLWRSVKYEEVYLRAYDSVSEARSLIGRYLAFTIISLALYIRPAHAGRGLRHAIAPRGGGMGACPRGMPGRWATPSSVTPRARNCKGPTPAAVHFSLAESRSRGSTSLLCGCFV